MNAAIIYHWWNDSIAHIKDDLFNPIIYAIATVRYFDKSSSIYVIDLSAKTTNWGNYPQQLDFSIIKQPRRFTPHPNYDGNSMGRIWDISETTDLIPEQTILFNDADVFWVKHPFPLLNSTDKFNCNRNNGVFYFDKTAADPRRFIQLWKERNLLVMFDSNYRNEFYDRIKFPRGFRTHDELVVRTIEEDYPDLCTPIKLEENTIVFTPITNKCKNIHLIRAFAGSKDRLSTVLAIKEIKDIIETVLNEKIPGTTFPLSDLITRKAIKHLCDFGGDYQRAIDYGASKLC